MDFNKIRKEWPKNPFFLWIFDFLVYGIGLNLMFQIFGYPITILNILGFGFMWYLFSTEIFPFILQGIKTYSLR